MRKDSELNGVYVFLCLSERSMRRLRGLAAKNKQSFGEVLRDLAIHYAERGDSDLSYSYLQVCLPEDVYKKLSKLAQKEKVTLSALLNRIYEQAPV